jgi:ketosteroid isomerase-like protein
MKKIIGALLIFCSCSRQPATDTSEQAAREIRDADIAMSNLAAKEGFFKALLTYAEDSMIIPREGKLPLMTKAEATTSWADKPVITEISWKPIKVKASKNGEMGYSFGFSTYRGKDTVTYTNYCTIWHKQNDGSWKFVYDGGNNTPKPDY